MSDKRGQISKESDWFELPRRIWSLCTIMERTFDVTMIPVLDLMWSSAAVAHAPQGLIGLEMLFCSPWV